jgi:hypothetical protein
MLPISEPTKSTGSKQNILQNNRWNKARGPQTDTVLAQVMRENHSYPQKEAKKPNKMKTMMEQFVQWQPSQKVKRKRTTKTPHQKHDLRPDWQQPGCPRKSAASRSTTQVGWRDRTLISSFVVFFFFGSQKPGRVCIEFTKTKFWWWRIHTALLLSEQYLEFTKTKFFGPVKLLRLIRIHEY